ncbi:MAG: quinate 5-dehydrogenase [Chloroflexi bacterium]|nr:quinate 5-dehydrogenase [Chloroflexota bacterium]
MKTAVSISLGSSQRDKEAELTLWGEVVRLRREGIEGNMARARARFEELDGRVDALGVGGVDLWVGTDEIRYPLVAAHKLIQNVRHTPVVDGGGLKHTLEKGVVAALTAALGEEYKTGKVLLTAALDRYGMAQSFFESGYEAICGDLGFGLGLPLPIRTLAGLKGMAKWLMPVVGRLPISVIYPTGAKQEQIVPKFGAWYAWATVIAGDCLYIKRHMPPNLEGKVIVTNTTTAADRALFWERGVKAIVTTTPVLEGRSFGTNMLEAALTAVAGLGRPLTHPELRQMIAELDLRPTVDTHKN